MKEVSAAVERRRSDIVLASWPGYLLETSASPLPSTENNFGWVVGDRLAPVDQARRHVASRKTMVDIIGARIPPVVVTGNFPFPEWIPALRASGYEPAESLGGAVVWRRVDFQRH